jgi:hypothetical protein
MVTRNAAPLLSLRRRSAPLAEVRGERRANVTMRDRFLKIDHISEPNSAEFMFCKISSAASEEGLAGSPLFLMSLPGPTTLKNRPVMVN